MVTLESVTRTSMNKTYRSIFISDVHLGSKDCKAGHLNNFLKHNTCESLYLIGDIIDAWKIKQSSRSFRYHVCCGTIPHILNRSLAIFENSHKETQ